MKERIGFMGLGIMGAPMAMNVAKAGYPLTVYNRTARKADELVSLGARVAATPRALAEEADVIIAMVTGPEALDALLWGPSGAEEALNKDKVFVNMSTVSPNYTRELKEKLDLLGVKFIDAPVSGSKKPAEDATLLILAGGEEKNVEKLAPLLATMGKKVIHCGEAGQGSVMKMAINLLLAIMMEGFAEVLNFGKMSGLSADTILDVVFSGPLNCGLYQMKAESLRKNDFPPHFPLKHMAKDLKFVVDTAYENSVPVPSAHTMLHLYISGVARQWGDLDLAAVLKVLQHLNPGTTPDA